MLVLIIEDDLGLTELVKEIINECGFQLISAQSGVEALEQFKKNTPDLIILDFRLPDMDGKEFITALSKSVPVIPPFLVSTGQGDEDIAVEMMKLGAKDYLIKNGYFLNKLPEVIKRIYNKIENEKKRKLTEEALHQSETQFKQLVWAMQVGVILQRTDSEIFLSNPKAMELLGLSENQLLGKTSFDPDWYVIHEDGSPFPGNTHPVPRAVETRLPVRNIVMGVYRPAQQDRVWILVDAVPELGTDGSVRHVVCTFTDITALKLAEEKLIKMNEQLHASSALLAQNLTEKNKLVDELTETKEKLEKLNSEKDKFFSIIAHDLKSPFQGFLGLTEVMAEGGDDITKEEIVSFSRDLNENANNLFKLLQNLLEWAQMQKGAIEFNPSQISLEEIITQNIDLIKNRGIQKGIDIVFDFSSNQIVFADEILLHSILRNLLSNAIKFSFKGGVVYVDAKEDENGMAEVSIKDGGIGMTEEMRKKIFIVGEKVNREGTEREKSTGLGLLLCKEFVVKHGGKIWVESEENAGSIFHFTLPKVNIFSKKD